MEDTVATDSASPDRGAHGSFVGEPDGAAPATRKAPRLLVSRPSPDGSVIVCAAAADTCVLVQFADEATPRDITALLADLLLLGLQAGHSQTADANNDLVVVGHVRCVGPAPELLFASPAAQVVRPVTFAEALPHIEAGIAAQIDAGVRHEREQGPDRQDGAPSRSTGDRGAGGDRGA